MSPLTANGVAEVAVDVSMTDVADTDTTVTVNYERAAQWFDATVTIPPQARELLEKYSQIPTQELEQTVLNLVGSISSHRCRSKLT